jgi:hypothetical protein
VLRLARFALPAPADAVVVVPVPAAAAAVIAGNADADPGIRTHGPNMRAGTDAIGPDSGSHADRSDLHAGGSAGLRPGGAGGDEAGSKK